MMKCRASYISVWSLLCFVAGPVLTLAQPSTWDLFSANRHAALAKGQKEGRYYLVWYAAPSHDANIFECTARFGKGSKKGARVRASLDWTVSDLLTGRQMRGKSSAKTKGSRLDFSLGDHPSLGMLRGGREVLMEAKATVKSRVPLSSVGVNCYVGFFPECNAASELCLDGGRLRVSAQHIDPAGNSSPGVPDPGPGATGVRFPGGATVRIEHQELEDARTSEHPPTFVLEGKGVNVSAMNPLPGSYVLDMARVTGKTDRCTIPSEDLEERGIVLCISARAE